MTFLDVQLNQGKGLLIDSRLTIRSLSSLLTAQNENIGHPDSPRFVGCHMQWLDNLLRLAHCDNNKKQTDETE